MRRRGGRLTIAQDYPNPYLSPYSEFQRMKHHPFFAKVLEGGKCLSYGARALNEGGFQSIPKVAFPGGALIGDTAGFLNVPKIKGIHNCMKSGMLAAESTFKALSNTADSGVVMLYDYEDALKESSIWKELREVRNMRPSFHSPLKLLGGVMYSGLEAYVLKGRAPWTLKHPQRDHAATRPAAKCAKIEYPKPDGVLSFDILTSVSRTGTNHEEDQPVHLQVRDWDAHAAKEWPRFRGVEARFCPAGVYEYVEDAAKPLGVRFQINAQNCIHCKTCDIKVGPRARAAPTPLTAAGALAGHQLDHAPGRRGPKVFHDLDGAVVPAVFLLRAEVLCGAASRAGVHGGWLLTVYTAKRFWVSTRNVLYHIAILMRFGVVTCGRSLVITSSLSPSSSHLPEVSVRRLVSPKLATAVIHVDGRRCGGGGVYLELSSSH